MTVITLNTLKPTHFFLILLLFVCSPIPYANEAFDLLLKAAEVTRNTAFKGIMEYKRNVFDEVWEAEFVIEHDPNNATKLVFKKPKVVEGNMLIRTNEGIWVTPLKDDERDSVLKEMEPFPFHRVLDDDEQTLFFQASLDMDHKKLLLQNYKVHTDYNDNNDSFFVSIKSSHDNRPSMKVHFDSKSKVQRSCKRFNYDGKLEESFAFVKLEANPNFPEDQFSIHSLKKVHSFDDDDNDEKKSVRPDFKVFGISWVPKGFELIHSDVWEGRHGITHHTLYTDGFAKISVFQRKMTEKEIKKSKEREQDHEDCIVNRFKRRTSWVYFRNISDLRITSVGDLSPRYIGKILSKIDK